MRTILATVAAVTLVALAGVAAEIKATTRLRLSPIGTDATFSEITDPKVLMLSNVFAGSFLGERVTAPNLSLARYTIRFDIQTRDGIKSDAYAVHYCVDAAAGQSFVYVPGREDPSYRRNVSTILREGQDGYWHRASREWSEALRPYVH